MNRNIPFPHLIFLSFISYVYYLSHLISFSFTLSFPSSISLAFSRRLNLKEEVIERYVMEWKGELIYFFFFYSISHRLFLSLIPYPHGVFGILQNEKALWYCISSSILYYSFKIPLSFQIITAFIFCWRFSWRELYHFHFH